MHVPVRVRRHAQAAKKQRHFELEGGPARWRPASRPGRNRPLLRPLMKHTTTTEQRGSAGTASKPISAAKTLAVPDMGVAEKYAKELTSTPHPSPAPLLVGGSLFCDQSFSLP